VAVETIEQRKVVRKLAPQYRVLLHNDPYNSMEYVVKMLIQTVPMLSEAQAVNVMMEAHNNGFGLVITCAMEPAEFYGKVTIDSSIWCSTVQINAIACIFETISGSGSGDFVSVNIGTLLGTVCIANSVFGE
jgi:ATP-dependent Clp protease adaptor protein ClpS